MIILIFTPGGLVFLIEITIKPVRSEGCQDKGWSHQHLGSLERLELISSDLVITFIITYPDSVEKF